MFGLSDSRMSVGNAMGTAGGTQWTADRNKNNSAHLTHTQRYRERENTHSHKS